MNTRNLGIMLSILGGMGMGVPTLNRIEVDPELPEEKPPVKLPREQYRSHEVGAWKGDGVVPAESRQQRRARLNKERAAEPQKDAVHDD